MNWIEWKKSSWTGAKGHWFWYTFNQTKPKVVRWPTTRPQRWPKYLKIEFPFKRWQSNYVPYMLIWNRHLFIVILFVPQYFHLFIRKDSITTAYILRATTYYKTRFCVKGCGEINTPFCAFVAKSIIKNTFLCCFV